jgi:hypothetical protein
MKTIQAEIVKPSINSGTANPTLKGNARITTGITRIASNATIPHAKLNP